MFTDVFSAAKSVSIRDVITRYTTANASAGRFNGNIPCPLGTHDDKKPSFHIYDNTNSFHCFSCQASGTPIDFVKLVTGITDNVQAAKDICEKFGITYENNYHKDTEYDNYVAVYKWCAELFVKSNDTNSLAYWKQRKLDSLIDSYLLGYCPVCFKDNNNNVITLKQMLIKQFPNIPVSTLDSYGLYDSYGQCVFADRFMFAIKDTKGNVVAFSGRSLTDQAKYKNSRETKYFKKRNILYNLDKAKGYPVVYVVEGQCDLLSLVASGVSNVVASLGTAFTTEHLDLLVGKQVVLAFDNDDAGHKAMARLIEDSPNLELCVLNNFGDKYKDFNEALMAGVDLSDVLNRKKLYGPEYLLDYLKNTLDLSDLGNRVELHKRVSACARYSSPIAKDYYAVKIQRLFKGKRRIE